MEYVRVALVLRTTHATVMWLVLFICTIAIAFAEQYASFLKLSANTDVRFEASIFPIKPMSITSCFTMCSSVNRCIYISYQENSQLCGIHEINQPTVTSVGWSIYFKRLDQAADYAIDGNLGNPCAHTYNYYSYWIMQFGMYGVVGTVDIRMRPQILHFDRNTNRMLTVAQTYGEAVNNDGIECGGYFGEPINSYPYMLTIQCESPIFGKFLRIQHTATDVLLVCEVFVYAP